MGFIGVIDSGIGGLTVLQRLRQTSKYNYVYIADHAFCPYGTKTNEMIFGRANKLVCYLKDQGAKAVVLACNTISAFAERLQQAYGLPIFDVITPTCNRLANSGVHKVALLATKSTIANGAYQTILSQSGILTTTFDCSSFVPYVEQCATTSLACQCAVHKALCDLPKAHPDAVILGCTHFPLLRSQIAYYCGDGSIVECCCDLPNNIATTFDLSNNVKYLTTGNADFANTASSWVKNSKVRFKHISLY